MTLFFGMCFDWIGHRFRAPPRRPASTRWPCWVNIARGQHACSDDEGPCCCPGVQLIPEQRRPGWWSITCVSCEPFLPALQRFHLQPTAPSPATTPTAFSSSSATHGLDADVVDKDTGPWWIIMCEAATQMGIRWVQSVWFQSSCHGAVSQKKTAGGCWPF